MSAIEIEPLYAPPAPRPRLHLVPSPVEVPARSTGVRLTRRGRVTVILAAALIVLIALGSWASSLGGSVSATTVTVQPGETLSQIAARDLPELSVAEGVARIQLANNLSGTEIGAGQSLTIPAH